MGWIRLKTFMRRNLVRRIGQLQLRAMAAVVFSIFGFGGLLIYVDRSLAEAELQKELFERTITTSHIIATLTQQQLAKGPLEAADSDFREALVQIARKAHIEHAVIHDAKAGLSLEFNRDKTFFLENDVWPCVEEVLETGKFASRPQIDQMAVAVPLIVDNKIRGAVSVIETKEFHNFKRGEAFLRALVIAGIFSALIIPTVLWFLARFLRPIRMLTQAARRLASGRASDLSSGTKRSDEIGVLARSFEKMTGTIQTKAAQERRLALVDTVTGLANRARLEQIVQLAITSLARDGGNWAIYFIDLDKFKRVNDTLGHDYGDNVLRSVAHRIEAACIAHGFRLIDALDDISYLESDGPLAFIARFGGDEFVLALRLHGNDQDMPARLAQSIVSNIQNPMSLNTQTIDIGVSIGIVLMPQDGSDPAHILRYADLAMYEAKTEGGGGYRFFTEQMSRKALERMVLEMDLHRAIGQDEIVAHYMPKISLSDGKICGFEALARWQHPEKGLIPPDRFIPIAEEARLIAEIDRIIMRQAAQQAGLWLKQGLCLPIAVNVAPTHVERADFADYVERVIRETKIPGHLLELEFTETAAMTSSVDIVGIITRLKKLGVRFAIDDFGTGYSNLAQLQRMPVDVLKIDRSLVRNIGSNPAADLLLKSIVTLIQQMQLDIVVEGVETSQQADILRQLGCTYGQGYLYGAPKSIEITQKLLENKPAEPTLKLVANR